MKVVVMDHPRELCLERFNDVANAPLSASLNTGYACAVATQCDALVEYLDFLSAPATADEMAQRACASSPDLILIHWVYDWSNGQAVADTLDRIKRHMGSVLIGAFGFFPTFCGNDLLDANANLDFVMAGEFETTLKALIESRGDLSQAGIRTRRGFLPRPPISNPDHLPWPRDLGRASGFTDLSVAASRGCYGNCAFCCIAPFYDCGGWRPRSVECVRDEIEHRLATRNTSRLYFVDPNFVGPGQAGQDRAIQMAAALKPLDISFGLEARVNDIHPAMIAALTDAGLQSVFLGVESGSPAALKRMRKGITPEQSSRAIKILRAADVNVMVGFIMFEPDSTIADLQQNFDFLQQNQILSQHALTANVLYHSQIILKGTPSFNHYAAEGRLTVFEKTPYEGHVCYRDARVQAIADCMRHLTLHYFRNVADRRTGMRDDDEWCAGDEEHDIRINSILCGTFQHLLRAADRGTEALQDIARQGTSDLAEVFATLGQ